MFSENLIRAVKLKCYISIYEDDSEMQERLLNLMSDAQTEVSHLIGLPCNFDFSAAGPARALFLNYMWYSFNDAQNEFESNYLSDIIKCRDYYSVNLGDENAD